MFGRQAVLAPKEYRAEMEREKRARPELFERYPPEEHDRVARNVLMCRHVYERQDYGLLADVRELIALRLAPWLRPQRPF